jgi:hypothetical protein
LAPATPFRGAGWLCMDKTPRDGGGIGKHTHSIGVCWGVYLGVYPSLPRDGGIWAWHVASWRIWLGWWWRGAVHTYIHQGRAGQGRAGSLSGISIHPSAFFSLILFPLLVGTHSPVLIKAFSLYLSLLVIDGTWWWWWWWWYIASFGAGRTAHRALFM